MGDRVAVMDRGVLQQFGAAAGAVSRARESVRRELHRLAGDQSARRQGRLRPVRPRAVDRRRALFAAASVARPRSRRRRLRRARRCRRRPPGIAGDFRPRGPPRSRSGASSPSSRTSARRCWCISTSTRRGQGSSVRRKKDSISPNPATALGYGPPSAASPSSGPATPSRSRSTSKGVHLFDRRTGLALGGARYEARRPARIQVPRNFDDLRKRTKNR